MFSLKSLLPVYRNKNVVEKVHILLSILSLNLAFEGSTTVFEWNFMYIWKIESQEEVLDRAIVLKATERYFSTIFASLSFRIPLR